MTIRRTISISTLPAGPLPPNTFEGCVSPPLSVSPLAYWTARPEKYLLDPAGLSPVVLTTNTSRDQEVSTYARKGIALLRLVDGKAVYFEHNADSGAGMLDIGILAGWETGHALRASGTYTSLYRNDRLTETAPGYSSGDTTGLALTFGVEGFDVYARCNGVEFARFKTLLHLAPGAVALLSSGNAGYGFRDIEIVLRDDAKIFSDTPNRSFDLRDFGLSGASGSGSISMDAPDVLVMSGAVPFAVGDTIIVEIGGEAGGGARGATGVGGTWPALSYDNAEAMTADASQPDKTWAWRRDTGGVSRFVSGVWTPVDPSNWYVAVVWPKALVAKIIAIDGQRARLDSAARAATRDARVYFDNWPLFDALCGERTSGFFSLTPPDVELVFPAGAFAFSASANIFSKIDWRVRGQGRERTTIFSPRGAPSQQMRFHQCSSTTEKPAASAFSLHGNARFAGFALNMTETSDGRGQAYPCGVSMSRCTGLVVRDVLVRDSFQGAVSAERSTDCWAYNCACVMTEGLKRYIQWQFQWSDCTRGGFVDCSVTSPILTAGFEIFRSTGTSMTRPVGINATLSVNSSGAWLIDEPSVAIEANSQLDTLSFSERNPIVNVNNNIQPPSPSISRGGTIRNPHIDHRSPINANGDILMGIIVNAGTPSIEIVADYFDRNAGGEKGLIVMGDWREPSRLHGAAAVLSTGGNTYVRGVRIVGTAKGYPNILVNGEASRAVSCIADTIVGEAHNCLTNAQWIAGGGR